MLTDSHAHVFWNAFDGDRAAVLERARAAGVGRMVLVGTNVATSRAAFELAAGDPGLYATAGVHPHDAAEAGPRDLEEIERLARRPDCVGVGETGLDLFKEFSPRARQLELFRWHLALARELDKPVVVHSRDAHPLAAEVIAEVPGVRGVMHCYTLGEAELGPYLDLGFHVSFSGVVTYPRNEANRRAAAAVPAERLLVETDCPFLPPQGRRGKRNEPALLALVVAAVAAARGEAPEDVAALTSANAERLFGLA